MISEDELDKLQTAWETFPPEIWDTFAVDKESLINIRKVFNRFIDEVRRLKPLAELGQAVLDMPANSSLHHHPLNENLICEGRGVMPWEFERPGELTTQAQDPLTAIIFHKLPSGTEPKA